jgi:hypothetical protein
MEGPARVLLAKAYYPYTSNQHPASHARALSGAAASIPNPALSMSLRSGFEPKCARGKTTARARKVGSARRRVSSESTSTS